MTKLLRLVPQYRALETEIEQAGSARLRAESDTREWKSRCHLAEEQRDKAQENLDRSIKQVANFQALMAGAHLVPFPDVYMPPARDESETGEISMRPGRRLMRDVQLERNRKAREQALEQFNRLKNPNGEPVQNGATT